MTETPDWLQSLRPPQEGQFAEAAAPSEAAEMSEWLQSLRPVEAEPPAETETPDWLSSLEPVAESTAEEQAAPELEAAEIPDWLKALRPAEIGDLTPAAPSPVAPEPAVPDWLASLKVAPAAMEEVQPAPQSAEISDWLQALEPQEIEPITEAVAPIVAASAAPVEEASPAWLTGEGAMPSPEEAMAYFARLTAGKEAELQAQAQAEAETRMAEIMGRKPEPQPQPEPLPPPVSAPIALPPAPPPTVAAAPAELVEAVMPAAEVEAEMPDWLTGTVPFAVEEALAAPEALPLQTPPPEFAEVVAPAVEAPLPVEAMPEAAHAPSASKGMGPDWWYQTLADEEGLPEESPPPAPAQAAPVVPQVSPVPVAPAPPAPAAPQVIPARRGTRPLGKAAPAILASAEPTRQPGTRPLTRVVSPLPSAQAEPAPEEQPPAPRAARRLVRTKPAPKEEPKPVVDIEALTARLRAHPNDRGALLDLARGWVQLGDTSSARGAYDELVRADAMIDQVIFDLEGVIESHPDDVDTIRLLGDAEMKAGHLQKALKLYRQALKKL
jgi:hypothetical protein